VTRNNNLGDLRSLRDCNENNLKDLTRNNWRASLVPAAAVIPAPIAYIKVVAVKKLVVELLRTFSSGSGQADACASACKPGPAFTGRPGE
jgi:hypothetical protein